jgi:hypothetical protein
MFRLFFCCLQKPNVYVLSLILLFAESLSLCFVSCSFVCRSPMFMLRLLFCCLQKPNVYVSSLVLLFAEA